MKFTKKQRLIIKKIATGEIKDIPSYICALHLSTFYKLSKENIEKRMLIDENGKTYKKLKDDAKIFYNSTTPNSLGILMPSSTPIIPQNEDYEDVPATISYKESSECIQLNNNSTFEYDFFQGINITKSFKDIKDFLTIWQFLKSEGLILEVGKKVTKADYEVFFEYKPISETKYGKIKLQKSTEHTNSKLTENEKFKNWEMCNNFDFTKLIPKVDENRIKDYRDYIDYYFEYNKENELICTQFIDKQIYGNSGLDVFIKKGFKTSEEINVNKTLIPAYLALVLTLSITLWQNFHTNNSDILIIQKQLTEIQETLSNNTSTNITQFNHQLYKPFDSSSVSSINKHLEEILNEIKTYKQLP